MEPDCKCLFFCWRLLRSLSQVCSFPIGTPRLRRPSLQWPASQRRTTRGCTPLTPSWSPSLSWAPWVCWLEQCVPDSSCTAHARTAVYHPAPPQPWRTTTLNFTTASSTKSNSTNSAAALRRESGQLAGESLSLFSFPPLHFSVIWLRDHVEISKPGTIQYLR